MIRLDTLTEQQVETARQWRNTAAVRLGLRTPYMLTTKQQQDFYVGVISNRQAPHRYWAAILSEGPNAGAYAGMIGITDIQWENGHGELSLLVNPALDGQGIGAACVKALLYEGFRRLRLLTIVAECYAHNPAVGFWQKMAQDHKAETLRLPRRKFWDGELHDALYVVFTDQAGT